MYIELFLLKLITFALGIPGFHCVFVLELFLPIQLRKRDVGFNI